MHEPWLQQCVGNSSARAKRQGSQNMLVTTPSIYPSHPTRITTTSIPSRSTQTQGGTCYWGNSCPIAAALQSLLVHISHHDNGSAMQ